MAKFGLSTLSRNFTFVTKFLLGLCLLLAVFLVILPFLIWKICVIFLAKIICPNVRQLSFTEAPFAADKVAQNDSDNRSDVLTNIGLCLELAASATEIDLNQFAGNLEKTLIVENKGSIKSQAWKWKSHLIRFCGYTFWKETSNFYVLSHVKKVHLTPEQNLQEYLNTWIRMPYASADSPLWEFIILKHNSKEYIAYKIHHSVADGLTVMQIPEILFQKRSPPTVEAVRVGLRYKLDFIFQLPVLFFEFIRLLVTQTDAIKFDSGKEVAQLTSTQTLNLIDLKDISKKHGVRLQTVLVNMYAGVIRRILESSGKIIPDFIVVPLPQIRPNRPAHFIGNYFNTMFVPVPLNNKSPLERLTVIESVIQQIHSSKMILMTNVFIRICSVLPYKLMRLVISRIPERYSLSPVLLPDKCSCESRPVTAVQSISGITTPTMGVLSVLISYKSKLTWTITGAKNLFQTQEKLNVLTSQFIMQELTELQASVSDGARCSSNKSDHCKITVA